MADFVYNKGSGDLADTLQPIDFAVDVIRVGLATSAYVADRDDLLLDAGGANDFIDEELTGTGYVAGHGNSGRKTLASKTITVDQANDRTEFDAADVVWTAINAGTAAQAVTHSEGVADDTTARPVSHQDTGGFPVVTNGGDLTIQWNVSGIFFLSTV